MAGVRQGGLVQIELHLVGGDVEGLDQTLAEGGVAIGHGPFSLQFLLDEQVHVPGGHHLLEHTDGGEVSQVLPVVLLAGGPGGTRPLFV